MRLHLVPTGLRGDKIIYLQHRMPHIYNKYVAFMYYIVYKTTNTVNNKEYIGIHKTINFGDIYIKIL